MIQEAESEQIKLPDREEITLCEAVTAVVYGKASNALQQLLDGEAETEEHSARTKVLIERLHSAAYAGRIKFRALKNGDVRVDGHKDIDRLYFSEPRGLRWVLDQIWSYDLSLDFPKFESRPPNFTMDWHDVHLDRKTFETFLGEMGASVQQSPDPDVPGNRKTSKTGLAGRPTSIQLVLPIARSRLNAGDYPESLSKFSEQLVEDLAKTEPSAHRMTAKAIRNNPEIRDLWHHKPPKIIRPS